MKPLTKRLTITAIVLMMAGCSIRPYKAEPISGVVIAEATGQPIPHAVVMATWFSQSPSFHTTNREQFEIQEAVADEQGRFTIPGWRLKLLLRWWGSIDGGEPALVAYKYGYQPVQIWNVAPGRDTHGFAIRWHGREKIALTELTGSPLEIAEKFRGANLPQIQRRCDWKKTVNMVLEMDKQMQDTEMAFKKLQLAEPAHDYSTRVKPWYDWGVECPGVIELIVAERKARNKEYP